MTLVLIKRKHKLMLEEQCFAFIKKAVNASMDEVVYQSGKNKTYITDGLATCSAVALYGSDSDCSVAFTHMSSAATEKDDQRKERILNEMLEYVLKKNSLSELRLVIAPSRIPEEHLIHFILEWVKQKGIACTMVEKGGDSAVFHMDNAGRALMYSTSLILKQNAADKTWSGHGVIMGRSEGSIMVEEQKKRHAFFRDEAIFQMKTPSDAHETVRDAVVAVSA